MPDFQACVDKISAISTRGGGNALPCLVSSFGGRFRRGIQFLMDELPGSIILPVLALLLSQRAKEVANAVLYSGVQDSASMWSLRLIQFR